MESSAPDRPRLRIALLSSELAPERAGGIATYTATIAPALAQRGHEVHVLSCAQEHKGRDEWSDGVWWHRRPLFQQGRVRSGSGWYRSAVRLATAVSNRRELARLGVRFDVVESPEWMAEGLLLRGLGRTALVVNLHTPLRLISAFNDRPRDKDLWLADRLEQRTVRRASVVTTTSGVLADELRRTGWLDRHLDLVRYPVTLPPRPARTASEAPPNVLVVGRLERRKAPELVVEALALLREDVADATVTFVGRSSGQHDGVPYGDWVARLAKDRCVRARFVPQQPLESMRSLYEQSRVVAVPSRFESFSIAALEGMSAERPVVCTSRTGASELVADTGAGAVTPAQDAVALADAIRPFLSEGRAADRAGTIGRSIVERECDPRTIAAQREDRYEQALGTRR